MAKILIAAAVSLGAAWILLIFLLFRLRPKGASLKEALRLLPDLIRLFHRLATDPTLRPGVRIRLWCLLGYLATPIDLVPDFIPVIGHADDAIISIWVLRMTVREAGPAAIRRHWPGTQEGLEALWRFAGLPD